ncbi:7743_t:CDS:2, partial [Acaulospora morrowiae]
MIQITINRASSSYVPFRSFMNLTIARISHKERPKESKHQNSSGTEVIQNSKLCRTVKTSRLQPETIIKAKPLARSTFPTPTLQTSILFSDGTKEAVNRLREQLRYYAVVEIRSQKFLVTKNDLVITHRLRDVNVGDELKLNRVLELGSKDYTIKGQPLVSETFYSVKATVIEQPKGPLIKIIKKKRRNRHRKHVLHKQTYTVLRISEVD